MLDRAFAEKFAAEWIAAWNNHNLEEILSHYTEDFEMASPLIIQIMGEELGKLKGKKAIGAYWAKGLELNPNLHFELISTLLGVESIVLYYRSTRGVSAEVFLFNAEGKVYRSFANYGLG